MIHKLSEPEKMALVVRGRAMVRMIEAAKVLLKGATTANERVIYAMAHDLAIEGLRALIAELPADLGAETLFASETVLGPVREMFAN